MKIRLLPVLVTIVLAFGILFGGYYTYRSVAVENPLKDKIHDISGVTQMDLKIAKRALEVQVQLTPDADLARIYEEIQNKGADLLQNREILLTIDNKTVPALEKIWSGALFDISQAMETRHYGDIPKTMKRLEQENPGMATAVGMDDEHVYIRLTEKGGKESKFVILPRFPQTMGVWPNE